MLTNYFKIAWRNLRKHKAFSFINIFGLAVGIASFWLIALYVIDELSYDRFNTKADRIFRVVQHGSWTGDKFDLAVTSPPYAAALKADFPQVAEAVRISAEGGGKITVGDKKITEGNMLVTDNSIFTIFSYEFLYGDPKAALSAPQSIVLTDTFARALFGDASTAFNKILLIDNMPTTVTGVIADVPVNAHFTFKALRSLPAGYNDQPAEWGNASVYTYVLLNEHDDFKKIEAASGAFFDKYLKKVLEAMEFKLQLQPLTDIHLRSDLSFEFGSNGDISQLYVFIITALFILIIAVINYVNLTTARSSERIKEIGVRKVIGSARKQLVVMFLAESVLLTFIAAAFATMIVQLALPHFNRLSGKSLMLLQWGTGQTLLLLFIFSLSAGIISGIYPAMFISGFRPIPAMKGQLGNQFSTLLFRKSLVVFQFIIAIAMIAGSCLIYQQLNFVSTKDLGFNKEQTLTFHINNPSARGRIAAIKQRLLQYPGIESVGVAGNPIGNNNIGGGDFNIGHDGKPTAGSLMVQNLMVDAGFIPTLEIKLANGRNFSPDKPSDLNEAIIVNETLVNSLGWKDAVGKRVRAGTDDNGNVIERTIIGVVKDFNTYSLQHKIAPLVLSMPAETNDNDNVYVRVSRTDIQASLNHITKVYADFDGGEKAELHFLDQNFAARYQTEQRQSTILLLFTSLAIVIACLGLLGLVMFTAQQRMKEIGIRKVLGASAAGIIGLLSGELMKLVLIASLIACPIAWYAMNLWLRDFAYKVEISWWIFLLAGAGASTIALVTVRVQSLRAALSNPVKSLRSE